MPKSAIKTVKIINNDIYKTYDAAIAEIETGIKFNEKQYAEVMLMIGLCSKEERWFYERQAKQMEWLVKQAKSQVAHKKLEKQMIRMIEMKTFVLVKDKFLKRYDEMCHALCEIWEEGVSIDEMTESDYKHSVEHLMKYRNHFNNE